MEQGNPGQDPARGMSLLLTHTVLMLWPSGKAPWPLHPAPLLRDSPDVAPRRTTNRGESTTLVPAPLPSSIPVTEAAARAAQKHSARAAETRCPGCREAVPGMRRSRDAAPRMQRHGAGVAEIRSWGAEMQCQGCSDAGPGHRDAVHWPFST